MLGLSPNTIRAVQMGAFLRVGILDMGVDSVIFLLEFLTISPILSPFFNLLNDIRGQEHP